MAESTRVHRATPLSDDEEAPKAPIQKRVRFPKGKKRKKEDEASVETAEEGGLPKLSDLQFAATERAMRRNRMTEELLLERSNDGSRDISSAEVTYEVGGNFEDGGILMEPFNLKQEREEGYFDAEGNYVEYVVEDKKDAWLDSLDTDPRIAEISVNQMSDTEKEVELSSEEIGRIKRRIADLLQPGEKVLQALRRLKGSSGKKDKMSEETKRMFDQLTEDSMRLMENGDYNVYSDEKEVFEREAEGYEHLARAREGPSSPVSDLPSGPGILNLQAAHNSSHANGDSYDMFGDDDENPPSDQPKSESVATGGEQETDYVYDESSGYYYSSSIGYYYDPTSGLYCSAESGKWYSYNEETGGYDEVVEGTAADPSGE
ncbi:hypothetical protein H6P81_003399 [Aristolochia fimbriata]|uniref:OCRE domain-containing protein n=1 Tax=Aristolochia fimbriata TaxID=158543 RepID=A0AAV7FFQ4_ARIFI|nr:hypothetical protein H6P81_003399 [Aristolochia fimbriata]